MENKSNIEKFVYDFRDASVAPQYHRSYHIIITPDSASITVNSYGTSLGAQTQAIKPEDWTALVALSEKTQKQGKFIAERAVGTKGYTLTKIVDGKPAYLLTWDSLNKQAITKETQDFLDKIHELAPSKESAVKEEPKE